MNRYFTFITEKIPNRVREVLYDRIIEYAIEATLVAIYVIVVAVLGLILRVIPLEFPQM